MEGTAAPYIAFPSEEASVQINKQVRLHSRLHPHGFPAEWRVSVQRLMECERAWAT